jgi:hypothetical protein
MERRTVSSILFNVLFDAGIEVMKDMVLLALGMSFGFLCRGINPADGFRIVAKRYFGVKGNE